MSGKIETQSRYSKERNVKRVALVNPPYSAYLYTNEKGVKTDDELFGFILNKYLPYYLKERKIKKKIGEKPPKFNFGIAYEEVKDYSSLFIFDEVIKGKEIIKRMQRDKVEFQTEHKKQIIDHNLGKFTDMVCESRYKPEELNKDSLYKAVIKLLSDKLEERRKSTQNMVKLKAPKNMLRMFEDNLNEAKMLREIFGREKNYVLNKLEQFLGR